MMLLSIKEKLFMYNKDLFERICNVSCSWDELKEFVTVINEKEFDLDNPFEKYYNVDRLISAIEKYQAKEIDAIFLACWMNAYNWIITGGFKIEDKDKSIGLKKFLVWQIVDWIDSLSFFNVDVDQYDLEEYKNIYKVLDSVLQDSDQCSAVFAQHGCDDDEVVVLISNDSARYFIKVYGYLDYSDDEIDFTKIEDTDLTNRVNRLLSLGYRELTYCNWE